MLEFGGFQTIKDMAAKSAVVLPHVGGGGGGGGYLH